MTELLHGELTYYLRGVGFHVHNTLKGGHREAVYEEAVVWMLDRDKVPYQRQPTYTVFYKGKPVGKYRPDMMLADGKVMLDFKVAPQIDATHKAQALSYLAVTGAELGVLMNFGASSLQIERLPNYLHDRQAPAWQPKLSPDILFPELTNQVMKTLHLVRHELGTGFLHRVYRRATRIELGLQMINFVSLNDLPLRFETLTLARVPTYLFLIENKILLSTIAVPTITHRYTERLRWAMHETNTPLGLIANFYTSRLELRFIRNPRA